MASMKILPLLLVLAFTARNTAGQREIGIPGTDERVQEISQDPLLLDLAARTGETVQITIDGPETVGIVQEGVNANLWCFPWLQRFPGGSIRWSRLSLSFDGDVRPRAEPRELQRGNQRINVNGEFDEWLNITRTLIINGAELADTAIYMCEVCISPEECHTANVTLFGIGGPPFIDSSTTSTTVIDPMADVTFRVGEDICLPAGFTGTVTLTCGLNEDATDELASARPTPSRAWFLDDDLLYRALTSDDLPDLRNNPDPMFYMDPPERMLLFPDVLGPSALSALGGGSIRLNLEVRNVSENFLPPGVTAENARMVLMQQILGEWSCEANNTFGGDAATTNIIICDKPCQIGIYKQDLSTWENSCLLCPPNSFSTVVGSRECTCFDGYYRAALEGPSFPFLALVRDSPTPPSYCRNLQVVEEHTRATTITVRWERPEITGRDDFYYNIFYSEDNQTFIQHNSRPYMKQDALVDYSLSGLKSLTTYTIRVTAENGVSGQEERDTGRRCETSGVTGKTRANAPLRVLGLCTNVVWTAPTRSYGRITGYDVRFVRPGSDDNGPMEEMTVTKGSRELFHVISNDIPQADNMLVQVRAKTSSVGGVWSELVPLGCSASVETTCPPCPECP